MKTSPIASQTNAATATNAANGQNYAQTFAYDIIVNITNKSDVSAYTYGQTNYASPHAVTAAGGKTYAYDNNGNLTGDGTWTHGWDYKDRLLESTEQGSGNTDHVKYSYDEGGTRVTKTNATSGKTTTYVSDLLDIEAGTEKLAFFANSLKLATLEQVAAPSGSECTVPASGDWTVTANCTISSFKTASGNVTVNAGVTLTIAPTGVLEINLNAKKLLVKNTGKVLVQQGGAIAQTGRLSPLPGGTTGGLIFHHADHLSGASVDTDTAGNVLQLTDYYPYGDSRIEEASTAFHNDYTYTGKERDEDTALLYYEARYYDSHLGRFISVDPWQGDINDPQSFNKYAYVQNNPLKYLDPDGKNPALILEPILVPVAEAAVQGVFLFGAALIDYITTQDNQTVYSQPIDSAPESPSHTGNEEADTVPQMTTPPSPAQPVDEGNIYTQPIVPPVPNILSNPALEPTAPTTGCGVNMSCYSSDEIGLTGQPDTTKIKWKDGQIKNARTYDENGNPKVDYDFNDTRNPNIPADHSHDWKPTDDGGFERSKIHNPISK